MLLTAKTPATTGAPGGAITTLVYDEDGYLLSVTGPAAGSTVSFTYDSSGRIRTIAPPEEDSVTLSYDNLNRLTKITYDDLTYDEVVYNRLNAERIRDRFGTMVSLPVRCRWTPGRRNGSRRPNAVPRLV